MTTELEAQRAALVGALEAYETTLEKELQATRLALGGLRGAAATESAPARAAGWRPREKRGPKAKPKKKAAKKVAKKKTPTGKRAAPHAIDEPTTRKGRVPVKVQVRAVDSAEERKTLVVDLVKQGYTRAALGQRLAPGLFDVNYRGDGVTVTWWPHDPEKAAA